MSREKMEIIFLAGVVFIFPASLIAAVKLRLMKARRGGDGFLGFDVSLEENVTQFILFSLIGSLMWPFLAIVVLPFFLLHRALCFILRKMDLKSGENQ